MTSFEKRVRRDFEDLRIAHRLHLVPCAEDCYDLPMVDDVLHRVRSWIQRTSLISAVA
jgi:hypothetical protein